MGGNPLPFTITGTVRGWPAEVTWSRGALTGDADAIVAIAFLIESEAIVMEAMPSRWPAALTPSWIAYPTVAHVFDAGFTVRGRVPDPPWFRDPPGTVY